MKHTILYGNGLNLLSSDSKDKISWNELLVDLGVASGHDLTIGNKPYTMVYEELILSGSMSESEIKDHIISKLKIASPNKFYDRMRSFDLDNYLTTNYEFNLEKSFEELSCTYKNNKLEEIYSIRTCVDIELDNAHKSKIWHIHGEIDRAKSISLGLNHYCGTIGKMDNYFKGTYEYTSRGERVKLDKLSSKLEGINHFDDISWIELFFTTNIHIIGLSLDYSETDLWWLFNRRARPLNFSAKNVKNHIIYYDTETDQDKARDKEHLLKAFNVEYIHINVDNNNWESAYSEIFDRINSSILGVKNAK